MFDYILEKGIKAGIFWAIGLFITAIGFGLFALYPSQQFPSSEAGKWQAVFLDNGQVYFGHLVPDGRSYVKLSNVYYLRAAGDLSDAGATINLINLRSKSFKHGNSFCLIFYCVVPPISHCLDKGFN
jgi:hypothetical protein